MPPINKLDPLIETLVNQIMKHLDDIEKERRRAKSILRLRKPSGDLVANGKKIGAWYYELTSIYLAHLDELYLKISLYKDLATKNKTANGMAGRLARRASKLSDSAATSVVVHIGIEAHHFIPQTLLKDWRFLALVFKDPNIMPAVNLTKLEHRGSLKIMEKLRKQGDPLPGILGNLPADQRLESITTAINNVVKRVRDDFPTGPLTFEQERTATITLLKEIEKVYDARFPELMGASMDLEGDNAWNMRKWFEKTRRAVADIR